MNSLGHTFIDHTGYQIKIEDIIAIERYQNTRTNPSPSIKFTLKSSSIAIVCSFFSAAERDQTFIDLSEKIFQLILDRRNHRTGNVSY